MIKIVQIGEGNFLRAFADHYFDALNREGGEYEVNIVKPISSGDLDKFKRQNNVYHIILRGVTGGKTVEDVYEINSVKNAINPFTDYEKYIALARDKDLKIVVSNTTEAGICFNEKDDINGFDGITYPAKLTKFLYERFNAGLGGLYMMPVELIDDNADELHKCVVKYIKLWNLPVGFENWIENDNYFCNTLVDRIVSGYPKDEETERRLVALIGKKDELMSVGEPFGLWAVEDKGDIRKYIKEGRHGIDVVLTKDIQYYKKRKVRVLNGSHTNLVFDGLWLGKETVYDCMTDKAVLSFVKNTLNDEIIPFVSDDIQATKAFADSVIERFFNPYLNHRLTSIALNSISKWRARDLPSFKDYYERFGKIPRGLTVGFSYLMATYKSVKRGEDGKYYVELPCQTIELKDDIPYLGYFADGGCVIEFMKDEKVWGEDLTRYKGFAEEVRKNVKSICGGDYKLL